MCGRRYGSPVRTLVEVHPITIRWLAKLIAVLHTDSTVVFCPTLPTTHGLQMPSMNGNGTHTAARKRDLKFSAQKTLTPSTIDLPQCKGPAFASLPCELVNKIFSYCDVWDLVQLGRTSRTYGTWIGKYLSHCIDKTFLPFVADVSEFHETLRSCDALVSGSAALHLLLPVKTGSPQRSY